MQALSTNSLEGAAFAEVVLAARGHWVAAALRPGLATDVACKGQVIILILFFLLLIRVSISSPPF